MHLKTLYLKGLRGFQNIIQTLIRNVIFKNPRYFGKNFEDRDFCPLRIKGVALEQGYCLKIGKGRFEKRTVKYIQMIDNVNQNEYNKREERY